MLPFMEQQNLFNLGQANGTWTTPLKVYICPSDMTNLATSAYTSYAPNALVFGTCNTNAATSSVTNATGGARYPASIPDGTSNTIFWTDILSNCNGTATMYSTAGTSATTEIAASVTVGTTYFYPSLTQTKCQSGGYAGSATSAHSAVVMAGIGDGSVRGLTTGINQTVYGYALIPNDGMPMSTGW